MKVLELTVRIVVSTMKSLLLELMVLSSIVVRRRAAADLVVFANRLSVFLWIESCGKPCHSRDGDGFLDTVGDHLAPGIGVHQSQRIGATLLRVTASELEQASDKFGIARVSPCLWRAANLQEVEEPHVHASQPSATELPFSNDILTGSAFLVGIPFVLHAVLEHLAVMVGLTPSAVQGNAQDPRHSLSGLRRKLMRQMFALIGHLVIGSASTTTREVRLAHARECHQASIATRLST